jgi:hypothetical protein
MTTHYYVLRTPVVTGIPMLKKWSRSVNAVTWQPVKTVEREFPLWYFPLYAEHTPSDDSPTDYDEIIVTIEFTADIDAVKEEMLSVLYYWKYRAELLRDNDQLKYRETPCSWTHGWLEMKEDVVVEWTETNFQYLCNHVKLLDSVKDEFQGTIKGSFETPCLLLPGNVMKVEDCGRNRVHLLSTTCWNEDCIVDFKTPTWLHHPLPDSPSDSIPAALDSPESRVQNLMYDVSCKISRNSHVQTCVDYTLTTLIVGRRLPLEAVLLKDLIGEEEDVPLVTAVMQKRMKMYHAYWNQRASMFHLFFAYGKDDADYHGHERTDMLKHLTRLYEQYHGTGQKGKLFLLWVLVEVIPLELMSWNEVASAHSFYFLSSDRAVAEMIQILFGRSTVIETPRSGLSRCDLQATNNEVISCIASSLLTYMKMSLEHQPFVEELLRSKREWYLHSHVKIDHQYISTYPTTDLPSPGIITSIRLYDTQKQLCDFRKQKLSSCNPLLQQHNASVQFLRHHDIVAGDIVPLTSCILYESSLFEGVRPHLLLEPSLCQSGDRVLLRFALNRDWISLTLDVKGHGSLADVLRTPTHYLSGIRKVELSINERNQQFEESMFLSFCKDYPMTREEGKEKLNDAELERRAYFSAWPYDDAVNALYDGDSLDSPPPVTCRSNIICVRSESFCLYVGPSSVLDVSMEEMTTEHALCGVREQPTHYTIGMSRNWLFDVYEDFVHNIGSSCETFSTMARKLRCLPSVSCSIKFLDLSFPALLQHGGAQVMGMFFGYYETTDDDDLRKQTLRCLDTVDFDGEEFRNFASGKLSSAVILPLQIKLVQDLDMRQLLSLQPLLADPRLQHISQLIEYLKELVTREESTNEYFCGGKGSLYRPVLVEMTKIYKAYRKKLQAKRLKASVSGVFELVVEVKSGQCVVNDNIEVTFCSFESNVWLREVFFRFETPNPVRLVHTNCKSVFPDGTLCHSHLEGTRPILDYVHCDIGGGSMKWKITDIVVPGCRNSCHSSQPVYMVKAKKVKTFVIDDEVLGDIVQDRHKHAYRLYNIKKASTIGGDAMGKAMKQCVVMGDEYDDYEIVGPFKRPKYRSQDNMMFRCNGEVHYEHEFAPFFLEQDMFYRSNNKAGVVTCIENGYVWITDFMKHEDDHVMLQDMQNRHYPESMAVFEAQEFLGKSSNEELFLFAMDSTATYGLYGEREDRGFDESLNGVTFYRPSVIVKLDQLKTVIGTTLRRVEFMEHVSGAMFGMVENESLVMIPDKEEMLWQVRVVLKKKKRCREGSPFSNDSDLLRFFAINTTRTSLRNMKVAPHIKSMQLKRRRSSTYEFDVSFDSWQGIKKHLEAKQWYGATWLYSKIALCHDAEGQLLGEVVSINATNRQLWFHDGDKKKMMEEYTTKKGLETQERDELQSLWLVAAILISKQCELDFDTEMNFHLVDEFDAFKNKIYDAIWNSSVLSNERLRHLKQWVEQFIEEYYYDYE